MAAEEHQPPRAAGDRLIGHEAELVQGGEARHDVRLACRRDRAAPGDLERRPHRLAAGRSHHLLRHVADDAEVTVAEVGMLAGRIGDREDVGAGDVERRPVGRQLRDRAARRLDDHERMVRIECLQPAERADEPFRPDPVGAPKRVARLVEALVDAESRVIPECGRDPRERLLAHRGLPARRRARRQIREVSEVEPALEAACGGRVEQRSLGRELLLELRRAPVAAPGPDEARTPVCELLQPVLAGGRLAAERGRIREPERKRPSRRRSAEPRWRGRS